MPPQKSGISDYSIDLLEELSKQLDIVAVVRDDVADVVKVPEQIPVIGVTKYLLGAAGERDLEVYQMGNHPLFHGYAHNAALSKPGLLVLHDVALFEFYANLCGGMDSSVFLEEARLDDPSITTRLPTIVVDGREEPDVLGLPLARRLIEASLATIVHSGSLRDDLSLRYPGALIRHVHQPVRTIAKPGKSRDTSSGEVVFGIFGSLERHKRVPAAVRAFAKVYKAFPEQARLVIAGRPDNPDVELEVRKIIASGKMSRAVRLLTDVPLETLEHEIASCDVAICLRWPTAGEVSAVLIRALGLGKPVIVSDVPQYADLDAKFCWRVATEPAKESTELEALMRKVMEDPGKARQAGALARNFVAQNATVSAAARGYLDTIEECLQLLAKPEGRSQRVRSGAATQPKVNVIADWQSTTGLAEAARRSVGALIDARVDVAAQEVEESWAPHDSQRLPDWLETLPKGRPHDIDICYLNVNELHVVSDDQLRPRGADNYVIGFWFWELPVVSKAFVDQIDRVDEIWVGSQFTREAFLGHTAKPVHVIPCVVTPQTSTPMTRKDLGLPEDPCIFVFHFDAHSTFARKNPWAVISAFSRAFSAAERSGSVRLVLKTINLSRCPPVAADRLMHEMRQVNGILLDLELSRDEMASLIACSDVYVSLHRSEGFGLGIAEAMLAGRPTIATAYSGNLDFMTHQNSCLVGYRLVPVTSSEIHFNPGMEIVYEPEQLWAQADIDQAARWMRMLYENPSLRERIGAAGSETIATRYNSAAAGAVAAARLLELSSLRDNRPKARRRSR